MVASALAIEIDGRYVLGELLGVGGMGRVYAARDAQGSPLAIKLPLAELADDPCMLARLADEARAGMRISHRNVVRVLDHGVSRDGVPYLVMDRVRGASLREVMAQGPLSLSRVCAITSQILAGLAAIHRAGLVHGDLKLDNVFVDSSDGSDRVTIIDLGLARPPGTEPVGSNGVTLWGTLGYMAPELLRGAPITPAA